MVTLQHEEGNTSSFPSDIAVIIPALDPDERLFTLVGNLHTMGALQIIVINDGSKKSCDKLFSMIEKQFGAKVLNHPVNRGKGAALKLGMGYILATKADIIGCITADADGQHLPEDILRIAHQLAESNEALILGSRDFSKRNVPWKSRMGNRITSAVFRLQTGRNCTDTQTGLRGIPAALMRRFIDIPGERYEYEMNVLLFAADNNIPFVAVPIQTVYINKNRASHFHPVRDSARVYSGILKFGAASLICFLVDIGLFTLLADVAFRGSETAALYAAVAARICSGVLNFYLNKYAVFGQRGGVKHSAVRYLLLFLCIMCISAGTTQFFSVLPINLTVIKILVDTVLFFVSFTVQRKFVFTKTTRIGKGVHSR
jgi:putative flippase GtrA